MEQDKGQWKGKRVKNRLGTMMGLGQDGQQEVVKEGKGWVLSLGKV